MMKDLLPKIFIPYLEETRFLGVRREKKSRGMGKVGTPLKCKEKYKFYEPDTEFMEKIQDTKISSFYLHKLNDSKIYRGS